MKQFPHRKDEERDTVNDGTIKSYIVTSEMRLLLVVQQFMITAALLPAHKRVFEGDVEPDPLVTFVDDAEALVQYIVNDLREQQDLSVLPLELTWVSSKQVFTCAIVK